MSATTWWPSAAPIRKIAMAKVREIFQFQTSGNDQFCVDWIHFSIVRKFTQLFSIFFFNSKKNLDCSSILDKKHNYKDFIELANDNLIRSWEYLFLSAQFGSHVKQRPGFEKILHGLSDEAWGKGFEMIKEASKRGFAHDFKQISKESKNIKSQGDIPELRALAKAADIEKTLLVKANEVHLNHQHATHRYDVNQYGTYDAALAHFLEEELIEKKTENVRTLAGHVNDIKKLYAKGGDLYSMSLFLFDQYLAK